MYTRVGSLLNHWMGAKAMSPMTIFSRYCLQQSMFLNGSRYSLRDVISLLQRPRTTDSITTILPFNGVSGNCLPPFVPICPPCIFHLKVPISSSTALRSSLSVDTNDEVNLNNDNRTLSPSLGLILPSQRTAASNPPIHLPVSQLHERPQAHLPIRCSLSSPPSL